MKISTEKSRSRYQSEKNSVQSMRTTAVHASPQSSTAAPPRPGGGAGGGGEPATAYQAASASQAVPRSGVKKVRGAPYVR